MNWIKVLISGVVAGVVVWLVDFVMHGVLLGPTYMEHDVFTKTQASPFTFLYIEVCLFICIAILFAKTFSCWSGGWKGGATFGFYFGVAVFFTGFFNPVVFEGFPYFLAWCWGGVHLIVAVIGGAVIGAIYKP